MPNSLAQIAGYLGAANHFNDTARDVANVAQQDIFMNKNVALQADKQQSLSR